jgi:hypothetical protein
VRGVLIAVAASAVAAAAPAAAIAGVTFAADALPAETHHGSILLADIDPSALTAHQDSPSSIAFELPRGVRLDTRARKRECSAAEAAAIQCPAESKVGEGNAVTRLSGYLFPGGQTDGVAWIEEFLGVPVQAGDPASLVLQIEWLGLDPARNAVAQVFGTQLPRRATVTGRIVPIASGPFGLELRFDALPGGLSVPRPLSAQVIRLKLSFGAVRRQRQNFTRKIRVRTVNGGTQTQRIHDHRLLGFHLLRRPTTCPGGWPVAVVLGFPSGPETIPGTIPCQLTPTG